MGQEGGFQMTYFNGGTGGYYWTGDYVPFVPPSRIYCDACAEVEIPLPKLPVNGKYGGRHWNTGFTWVHRYGGGAVCKQCGKEV
jgi:hypothetical protein